MGNTMLKSRSQRGQILPVSQAACGPGGDQTLKAQFLSAGSSKERSKCR